MLNAKVLLLLIRVCLKTDFLYQCHEPIPNPRNMNSHCNQHTFTHILSFALIVFRAQIEFATFFLILESCIKPIIMYVFRNHTSSHVNKIFGRLQICSSIFFSLTHGANDGQKNNGSNNSIAHCRRTT